MLVPLIEAMEKQINQIHQYGQKILDIKITDPRLR